MSMFLVGCGSRATTPVIDLPPAEKSSLPFAGKTESALSPTTPAMVTGTEYDKGELLKNAIANLQDASSFQMAAHVVRAYQIMDTNGTRKLVYGEFNTKYSILRLPALKVDAYYEERYNPQGEFIKRESYVYQENGKYFIRFVEASNSSHVEVVDPRFVEPFSSDVYQTLVTYYDQAEFITENNGVAVYSLDHPAWYELQGAVGFADLGFLHAQENGEQLVEQYVSEHYPNIRTIQFRIYMSLEEQVITKVLADDTDFMISVWEEVDRALIEHGEKPENLTRYEVMRVNGAEYLFTRYNQVQDFEIP